MTRHLYRRPTGQIVPTPAEPCIDCGIPMLGHYTYAALPDDERKGFRRHQSRGRCGTCYHVHRGDTAGHEGRWSRDDLVYEWEFLADQGYDRRAAARRLHVSYGALCKAIERVARDRATTDSTEVAA